MDVLLINESTLLTLEESYQLAWALDYQARFHYGRAGWRGDVRVHLHPPHITPHPGTVILHLLDTADVAGALGYHDEDGNELPYARVFVKTAQDDGVSPSEVASHELLELATDPHVNDACLTGDLTRLYAKEVGDACQGNGYDVGMFEGRTTGFIVADFLLPSYFDPNTPAEKPTDFRGALHGPFALGAQGYYSYIDLANITAGWQQTVGSERTAPVSADRDERLGRRATPQSQISDPSAAAPPATGGETPDAEGSEESSAA